MRVFITRPRDDALPLAERLRAAGHDPVIVPVLEIVARQGVVMPSGTFQAICVTSANGMRCLEGEINASMPVFAVGAQSAAAARARGFTDVTIAGGDVHRLAAHIITHLQPADGPLLYVSGGETSGDLQGQLAAAGFQVTRLITYDAQAQKVDLLFPQLMSGDAVLLYSPRSAKLWAAEVTRLQMENVAGAVTHYCLSPQVAAVLPPQFRSRSAARPDAAALLALLDLAGEAE